VLFRSGNAPSTIAPVAPPPGAAAAQPELPHAPAAPVPSAPGAPPNADVDALIAEAARDLADYQRLTAEGRLGEAGQKLEALKRALEQLAARRR